MFTFMAIVWFCFVLPMRFYFHHKKVSALQSEVLALKAGNDRLCRVVGVRGRA